MPTTATYGWTTPADSAANDVPVDLAALAAQMGNALQFSSESRHNGPICETLRAHGALAAQMTGSGAAVFGVFREEAAAQAARTALLRHYPQCWVVLPVPHGAHVAG